MSKVSPSRSKLRLTYDSVGEYQSMDKFLKILLDYYQAIGLDGLPPRVANAVDSLLELR